MTAAADREKIAKRIRALRNQTVANGCTEEEAATAADLLAKLLGKYNMTLDEATIRESPFEHHTEEHDDLTGSRLWKIADGIAFLIGVRYWQSAPGVRPVQVHFFGLSHEVEVARYMLEVCAGAMRREHARMVERDPRLFSIARQRRVVGPYLDGMADRLRERIRAMVPPRPPGTGLVLLKNEMVDQAMRDDGWRTKQRAAVGSRELENSYRAGRAAGDRIALNRGLAGRSARDALPSV